MWYIFTAKSNLPVTGLANMPRLLTFGGWHVVHEGGLMIQFAHTVMMMI
jgi:hypothetical protein